MAGNSSGYDLSVATFSPDGRVFQVEYASKAVDSSPTVAAAICRDGIVLAADSYPNYNTLANCPWRIFSVGDNIGMLVAGYLPDAKELVRRARDEFISYKKQFGMDIPIKILVERLALYLHAYTVYWHVRPFGSSFVLAGKGIFSNLDEAGFQLFSVDLSGAFYKYQGTSLGKGKHNVKSEIEKLELSSIDCKTLSIELCRIIMQSREETKDNPKIQLAWIRGNDFELLGQEEIKEIVDAAQSSIDMAQD